MSTNPNKRRAATEPKGPRAANGPIDAAAAGVESSMSAGDGGDVAVDERDDEIAALEERLAQLLAPPPPPDPKEARLAELRAAVAEAEAAKAPDREMDAKDHTIAELRRQLAEINSTPEGAAAEMAKALAALQAQVNAMATGTGKIPVPVADKPDPYLYGVSLSCGCVAMAQHPHATHSFCVERDGTPRHGDVDVKGYWRLAQDAAGEPIEPVDTQAELAELREAVKSLRGRVMGAFAAPAASDET